MGHLCEKVYSIFKERTMRTLRKRMRSQDWSAKNCGGVPRTPKIKMDVVLVIWALLLGNLNPNANAGFDYHFDSKEALKAQYEVGVTEKLTRGITNTVFGWTEIARTPAEISAGIEHGAVTGFLIGVPYGIFKFGKRTVVGVYEIVTCYAPQSPIIPSLQGEVF